MGVVNTGSILEQMYADFTMKLMPKVSEGLVITKDYFLDLFGRYVDYLIFENLTYVLIGLVILAICFKVGSRLLRLYRDKESSFRGLKYSDNTEKSLTDEGGFSLVIGGILILLLSVGAFCSIINSARDGAKLYFVPEIYIMEKLDILKPNILPK